MDSWQERTYSRVLTERAKSQSIASSELSIILNSICVLTLFFRFQSKVCQPGSIVGHC
jgi:hypothetical protein